MISTENPWLEEPHEIPKLYKEWRPRAYFNLLYPLISASKLRRSVVLLGPRRVGKTVLIHHLIQNLLDNGISPENIFYCSVDHPVYNGLDLEELISLFSEISGINYRQDRCFIFFDEIQYLKDWERYLKAITDRYPKIKCTVSGSAAAALRLKSLESGAGRFTEFLLPPLTFYEYLLLLNEDTLINVNETKGGPNAFSTPDLALLNNKFIHYLNFGGYPEVIFSKEIQSDPSRFIKSDIIDKVLLRDLPSLYGITDIQELNSLFLTLAFNTAQEVSLDQLSIGSGLAKNTIKRYIEYLQAAFLIRIVHRVDRTAKRFRRANFFKVYLTNPSMWSALFSPISGDDEPTRALVETAIYSQWFHSDTELHYARWDKGEVDIVDVSKKQQKADWAVEVKWSDRYFNRPEELKSLLSFCSSSNVEVCLVTTRSQSGNRIIKGIPVIFEPASIYCYELGYNIIRGKTYSTHLFEGKGKAKHRP